MLHAKQCRIEPTSAREVRIEIQSTRHRRSRGWLLGIARQQAEDIVASSMSRFNHQAQIRRQCSVVGRSGRLIVLVRRGHVIAEFSRTFFDFTFVIGFGVKLVFFRHGFHFVDGVGLADKGSVGNTAEGVAGRADFAVDLEAAAETIRCQIERICRGHREMYA